MQPMSFVRAIAFLWLLLVVSYDFSVEVKKVRQMKTMMPLLILTS